MRRVFKIISRSLRHPLRAANVALLRGGLFRKSSKVHFLPSVLDIEPTTRCNLKCKMCQVPNGYFGKIDMSFDDFKSIIDQFPHLIRIKLQGMGEPFLNKEIFRMIEYAASKGIVVGTTTNGVLIDEDMCRKILNSGLSEIYFSIDGATKQTFEDIRTGANFDVVIENMKRLVKMKGTAKTPLIAVWFVSMKENIHELPQLVTLCKDIGVQRLTAQLDICFWGKKDLEEKVRHYMLGENIELQHIQRAEALAREHSIAFIVNQEKLPPGKLCDWPWSSAYITAEGKVVPCCLIADAKMVNFGSLRGEGIKTIWNNPSYRAFRKSLLDGKIPEYCKDCFPD